MAGTGCGASGTGRSLPCCGRKRVGSSGGTWTWDGDGQDRGAEPGTQGPVEVMPRCPEQGAGGAAGDVLVPGR